MPLLDTIREAEQAGRRLSEAVVYDFAPTADRLRRLLRDRKNGGLVDNSISEEIKKLLEKDRQIQTVYEELVALCIEVDKGIGRAMSKSG